MAAVHTEAGPRGGLLQPGRPPGARGESARPEGSGRGCGPGAPSQAPAEGRPRLVSPRRAPLGCSSRGETEGQTGRAAGGDATPSLRASAPPATEEEAEGAEGAEQRRQAPQPRARPPPPRARARAHPSRAGAASRARALTCSLRNPACSLEGSRSAHTQ